jgi:fructose-bisphosphate aldolase class 1
MCHGLHTSTLSQRQFPQGAPSTTSHRTLRARHDTQARAARRFVTLCGGSEPSSADARFFDLSLGRPLVEEALSAGSGDDEIDGEAAFTAESSRAASDDIVAACEFGGEIEERNG